MKTRKIFTILIICIIILVIAVVDVLYFLPKFLTDKKNSVQSPNPVQQEPSQIPSDQPDSTLEENQNAEESSENTVMGIIDLSGGQPQFMPRQQTSLEAKLAQFLPDEEKKYPVTGSSDIQNIDISRCEKITVNNINYNLTLTAFTGKFLSTTNTSYLLEVQIPSLKVFKWYAFDVDLKLISSYNLKQKNIDLPGKILEVKDFDSDGIDEVLLESTKNMNNKTKHLEGYTSTKYLFKMLNNQVNILWKEDGGDSSGNKGRGSSVEQITYAQTNPPPADQPDLVQLKKVFTSNVTFVEVDNKTFDLINRVTYEEIRDFGSIVSTPVKTTEFYRYKWDIPSQEYTYFEKLTRNGHVGLDEVGLTQKK